MSDNYFYVRVKVTNDPYYHTNLDALVEKLKTALNERFGYTRLYRIDTTHRDDVTGYDLVVMLTLQSESEVEVEVRHTDDEFNTSAVVAPTEVADYIIKSSEVFTPKLKMTIS